jgi:2-hydroxy-3-keto-5-methylthiopentenyl-1-phosphate phosphatase
VHIGDGRSDVCVSDIADIVFAKDHLLESRARRGLDSIAFESFAEIRALLPDLQQLARNPAHKIA